jgi:hypothetical protein
MTIHMDDHKGKHSAKGPRTNAQRTAATIPVGGVEHKFLVSCVFFLLPPKNKKNRSKYFQLNTSNRLEDHTYSH